MKGINRLSCSSHCITINIHIPRKRRHLRMPADLHYLHWRHSALDHSRDRRVSAIVKMEIRYIRSFAGRSKAALHIRFHAEDKSIFIFCCLAKHFQFFKQAA